MTFVQSSLNPWGDNASADEGHYYLTFNASADEGHYYLTFYVALFLIHSI